MLLLNLNLLATAPGGVARLRELILTLAVQGKLVPQDPKDEPARALLARSREHVRLQMEKGLAKKEKPATAVSEEEADFHLPIGWQWCRLTDTGQYINGLAFKPTDQSDTGLPIIRIQNLSGRSRDFNRAEGNFDESVIVETGDILVSWSATLDAYIWAGERGVLNQHIFRVEPSTATDKRFLYWLLKWAIRKLASSDHAHGLVMAHINRGPFLAMPVGLPPLAEQSRIVTRIEELMCLCDALEAKGQIEATQHAQLVSTLLATLTDSETPAQLADNWHRIATHFDLLLDRPEAVDALEQTILQLAMRGLLIPQDPQDEPASVLLKKIRAEKDKLIAEGKIKRGKPLPPIAEDEQPFALPQGWEWARLVDVALRGPTNGLSPKPQELPTDVRCLSLSATTQGYFKPQCFKYVDVSPKAAEQFFLKAGDLLIQRGNSLDFVGMAAIYDGSDDAFIYPDLMMRLQLSQSANTEFIHAALVCAEGRSYFQRNATGTQGTMPKVNQATVAGALIPLPPLAEQSRIVTRVAQLRRLCADLRQHLAASQSTKAHLAEALIQEV
jgi:type I restriction enzyme, S subunit